MSTAAEVQRQMREKHLLELLEKIVKELEAIRKVMQEAARKLG